MSEVKFKSTPADSYAVGLHFGLRMCTDSPNYELPAGQVCKSEDVIRNALKRAAIYIRRP